MTHTSFKPTRDVITIAEPGDLDEFVSSIQNRPVTFVEPFAGGAIVGLTVAFENLADKVVLVQLDERDRGTPRGVHLMMLTKAHLDATA